MFEEVKNGLKLETLADEELIVIVCIVDVPLLGKPFNHLMSFDTWTTSPTSGRSQCENLGIFLRFYVKSILVN